MKKIKYQGLNVQISSLFEYLSGISGLYGDVIYNNININKNVKDKYKILSSAIKDERQMGYISDCKIKGKEIPKFVDKDGILIARKGKAGTLTFLQKGRYTLTEVAYVIYLKDEIEYDISLEWFFYSQQKLAYNNASNSDNGTFSIERFMGEKIDIPDIKHQEYIVQKYRELEEESNKINLVIDKVNSIFEKYIEVSKSNSEVIQLTNILKHISRNDVFTEETLYNYAPKKKEEKTITVLSGSTDDIIYGKIRNTDKIDRKKINKTTLDKHYLHVVRNGKAGRLTYIGAGNFAPASHAYLLYLDISEELREKLQIKNNLNEIQYLKFLKLYLEPIFIGSSSRSDNSTFSISHALKQEIPIIPLTEEIIKLVDDFEYLQNLRDKIMLLKEKVDSEHVKEIVIN
ncbi:hypothetical protein ABES23_14455 [Peribacillus frigoritolerans]|uniref:hypothetical protein n=1 Tax=Peribacillus frigoritolerans TaxID=450367 RepID=UPI003D2B2094